MKVKGRRSAKILKYRNEKKDGRNIQRTDVQGEQKKATMGL